MERLIKSFFRLFGVCGFLLIVFLPVVSVQSLASGGFGGSAPATPSLTIDVWTDGKMPGKGALEPEQDMPAKPDQVKRITNISRPTLTIFPAPKKDVPPPAVIICPGGGYNYVVYDKEGTEVAAWLNSVGITALVLKYRVPRNRDGAFQDMQRAISLTRANAAVWNINPKQLGVIGFSAGGNLAAKASTLFEQPSYPSIDEVDRQSSRPDFVMLIYPAYLEREGQIATDLNLKSNIPPTFIVTTEDDKNFVAGCKLYHAALEDAKVPNEFHLYPTGGHGYGLRSDKDVRDWPQAALEWLRKIGIRQSTPAKPVAATQLPVTLPAKAELDIYLLMGQSNMVGRDTRTLADQTDNPRILALNGDGRWVVAREPMHTGGTGIGPGIAFALEMLKSDPKKTVGLVPCAVGGTPLRRWIKGADLFEQCLIKAKKASQDGTVKGVLWHQGESDTDKEENASTYETRLSEMFIALRQDLGDPNLPIVVGQLGDFLTMEKYPYADAVRTAIKEIPTVMRRVGYADSTGLGHKGDCLHFSADAETEFGRRFGKAMQDLQQK